MFAAIHVRDAFALFAVTLLAWTWVSCINRDATFISISMIVITNIAAVAIFGFLRREFIFVPFAMAMAYVASIMFANRDKRTLFQYFAIFLSLIFAIGLVVALQDRIMMFYDEGQQSYLDKGRQADGASSSLGLSLIFEQPLPIRMVLGTIYLYLFPIPFWSGFSFSSFYHVFKGFNALLFYAVIPMFLQSVWMLFKNPKLRTKPALFLLFTSLGFSFAIVMTSAENRHLGAFLPLVFLLAVFPDYSSLRNFKAYKTIFSVIMMGVVSVHLMWVVLKSF
ncbi:MAG: hypothetical protein IPM37_19640 [Hahellaceae bacterium]|nr:hypothetical protein [Hahellaceae bacterium]